MNVDAPALGLSAREIKPGKLATANAIRILNLNRFPAEIVDEAMLLSSELAGRSRWGESEKPLKAKNT